MIMRTCLFTIFFFVFSFSFFSQELKKFTLGDTLIYFNELTFNSNQEKNTFEKVINNKSDDYFTLIYLVKKGVNAEGVKSAKLKLENQITTFKNKKVTNVKAEKKFIKKIYKDVHEEFFKKYQSNNHFDDVFTKGYYNCLSSTFLYSLILEELKIPYQINILPNHVNLTAYPHSHNILLETTDPVKGYFTFDRKFKEQYVNSLVTYKFIEKSELSLKSIDEVFDTYYNTNEIVNIKELVGAQYYNDGLYLMQKENYIEAIEQLEKSIAIYLSLNTGRILVSLYSNELKDSDYSKLEHFNYLIRFSRYKELKIDENNVVYALGKVASHQLLNKKDTSFFKSFYVKLDSNISDVELKKKLNFVFLGAMGEYYIKMVEYGIASEYFLDAIKVGGDTLNLLESYVRSTILYVDDFNNKEKALEHLNSAENNYEDLKKNRLFMSYKAEVISLLMMRNFERNKGKLGENYRAQLEAIYSDFDIKINETNVGIAYAQAGSYYFRKGNRTKARQLFKKGLEYSPGNYELESRLQMLNY